MPRVLATWRLLVLTVLLAAGGSSAPVRAGLVGWSIDRIFQAADVVATVRIVSSEALSLDGESCGTRYTAEVTEAFKGADSSVDRKTLSFGRGDDLQIGGKYVAFLERQSAELIYERIASIPRVAEVPKATVLRLIECNGLVPGLNLLDHGAWPIGGDHVFAEDFILTSIPGSIDVVVASPIDKSLDRAGLLYYLRGLR